jgi:guanylate kinase
MLRRLRNAREELLSARDFDHAVVNEELQAAVDAVRRLVRGQTPPERVAPADVDREVERLRAEIDDILAGALVESLPPTD